MSSLDEKKLTGTPSSPRESSSLEALSLPDSSSSTNQHFLVNYSAEEEAALVRKIDWKLLPGLTFLYLLSFLDRSNVGNARM